ncbi:EpsG family protein [Bacillus carboniphilus]|uniref:EpsG family protein n=1 Tax=Bacillus carboniphilus TaxID=86663 RepID=A0ABY9JQ94_9BACI|nr:EpsG family protein [Bacillus carboniphilus]WLR41571.1 EpsG family protein [Bacillus carboniphilus]
MVASYLIYIFTVFFAVLFAALAQRYSSLDKEGKKIPNSLFLWLSMLIMIYIIGFRDMSVGVDGLNYYRNYIIANNIDIISYYQTYYTEPGFYLLYRISYILGDVQWLFILSAAITIFFFYKALSYEIDKINFTLAIFIFATTQYFYYFGIMRMGIAVSIVVFAYRYIIEGRKKKFIMFVLFATMFHYSALFSVALLFLSKNDKNLFKKSNLLKLATVIPVGLLSVKYLIFPFITIGRYQAYIESSGVIGTSFISSLPFLGLFLLHYNKLSKESANLQFYFFLFVIKVLTEIFAPLIGIGRMVWYVNLSICFLFPATIRLNKDKGVKAILLLLLISYCLIYSYYAYFGDSFRGEHMLPYKNVLFNLEE